MQQIKTIVKPLLLESLWRTESMKSNNAKIVATMFATKTKMPKTFSIVKDLEILLIFNGRLSL